MPGASITRHIRAVASRFVAANQGNIAVIFAIACVPLISFVGAAVDYSRLNAARASMQSALDSAALMVSKDLTSGVITNSQISATAQNYFTALYTNADGKSITIDATYTAASGSTPATIKVDAAGNVTTDFMRVAGFPKLDIGTTSTTTWGTQRMRVALVLDVTGSMANDGKMAAMKPAAKKLIDTLAALAANPGDVYISLVPFAKDVNVGASNHDQNWINWADWDNANQTCTGGTWTWWGGWSGQTCTPKDHNTWNGCVTDRDQNYDTLNTAPTG